MTTFTSSVAGAWRRGSSAAAIVLGVALLGPAAASAQETRAAAIAAQQAAKAAALVPAADSKAERRFLGIKNHYITAPTGIFPAFGSVMGGGGVTAGLGYRHIANDTTTFTTKGLWSLRNYKQIDAEVVSNGLAGGRVDLTFTGGWKDATQVAFYGIGMHPLPTLLPSAEEDAHGRADFRLQTAWAGGHVAFRPQGVLRLNAGAAFEHYSQSERRGSVHPSIEEQYPAAQVPGLGEDHAYVHLEGTAGIDWRSSPGYARRGGLYAVTLHDYLHTDDRYSFRRLDADVVQHLPLIRESLVLSLRGRVQSTLGDDPVPFYLLPSLGSGSTLRGFSSFRFRDRHSLLMSAEYRWTPNRAALDAAIFVDSGKVAAQRGDLNFDGLKTSVGIGVRLHTPAATPLRIDLAKSNEGLRLVFSAAAAF